MILMEYCSFCIFVDKLTILPTVVQLPSVYLIKYCYPSPSVKVRAFILE
jgi:hypothetical protein